MAAEFLTHKGITAHVMVETGPKVKKMTKLAKTVNRKLRQVLNKVSKIFQVAKKGPI